MNRLGYYTPRFPFPQGASAGPYPPFAGRRSRVALVMVGKPPCACGGKCKRLRRRGLRGLGDAGFPSGSLFVYNATFSGPPSSDVENAVAQVLPSFGIVVDSYKTISLFTPGQGFTLNGHVTEDFGAAGDVKSIIDHQVYINGSTMPTSTLVPSALAAPISQQATTPANSPAASSQVAQDLANAAQAAAAGDTDTAQYWTQQAAADASAGAGAVATNSALSWLESNAVYVAGGVLVLALIWRIA